MKEILQFWLHFTVSLLTLQLTHMYEGLVVCAERNTQAE